MPQIKITCDREGGFMRCAVWQGKTLIDLYVDRVHARDLSGAIARGKIVRTANSGRSAWIDAGLPERLYVESKLPLTSGAFVTARIKATSGQGKAWSATLVKEEGPSIVKDKGLIAPPPLPWQRALAGLGKGLRVAVSFGDKDDYQTFLRGDAAGYMGTCAGKELVHPELDEIIDALCRPIVPLSGGASLVIERTQALVAIDVNSGAATANATAVNLLAVREAARQLRLRNLSGLIVIDCLKMKDRADVSKIVNAFARAAEGDPAQLRGFGLTKLGLLEATRERHGPCLGEVLGRGA